MADIPRLDKTVLVISEINDIESNKKYWLSKSYQERLEAIEINRILVYGEDKTSARLQRFLEVFKLEER